MKIHEFLQASTKLLSDAGIGTSRLDTLVLLEDTTGKDRAWLLAHPEYSLQGPDLQKIKRQVKKRAKHIPLSYIREKTEFYGREFYINKHVLEPRPESETMIELLKQLVDSKQLTTDSRGKFYKAGPCNIVDVGTGSGALGITAKLEIPHAEVFLNDIDRKCLKVAEENAKRHVVDVEILQGNLLEPLKNLSPNTYLLCNLPYVPDPNTINEAAMWEPKHAIFGGPDGLDLYRELFRQIQKNSKLSSEMYVLTESLPPEHKQLAKIAEKHRFKQIMEEDFIQVFKNSS